MTHLLQTLQPPEFSLLFVSSSFAFGRPVASSSRLIRAELAARRFQQGVAAQPDRQVLSRGPAEKDMSWTNVFAGQYVMCTINRKREDWSIKKHDWSR